MIQYDPDREDLRASFARCRGIVQIANNTAKRRDRKRVEHDSPTRGTDTSGGWIKFTSDSAYHLCRVILRTEEEVKGRIARVRIRREIIWSSRNCIARLQSFGRRATTGGQRGSAVSWRKFPCPRPDTRERHKPRGGPTDASDPCDGTGGSFNFETPIQSCKSRVALLVAAIELGPIVVA